MDDHDADALCFIDDKEYQNNDHDHYYDHKETWGFCCQCPACSEDRDEPIRLLLSQLKPRCADVH